MLSALADTAQCFGYAYFDCAQHKQHKPDAP